MIGIAMQHAVTAQPQDILRNVFGYETFRPYQREAIELIMQGRSVLVVLPTGGGKSLVYQVPAIARAGLAIVFSPLISLMRDQVDALRAAGVRAAVLNSTLTSGERDGVCRSAVRGELDLLYIAPEGFFTDRFQDFLHKLDRVSLIAVDEAHCISEWGHEFRPEYRQLSRLREQFPNVPIVAATATATAQVRHDIIEQLRVPDMETLVGSFERSNLTLRVEPKRDLFAQVSRILARHRGEAGIIYAATRKKVEELDHVLNESGFRTLPYHAGMDATLRDRHQRAFANDEVETIVATVAFGMGIDKSNVRYVIHAGMPKSLEGYYQEVGRAGRDGLPAECVAITANGDIATQQYFIDRAEQEDERARMHRQLERIVRFMRTVECRHAAILSYFGEERNGWTCGDRCDACQTEHLDEHDVTEDAQRVLAAVAHIERGGFPVGAGKLAQVLAGSAAADVARFAQHPTFGALRGRPRSAIRDLIDTCIDRGFLAQESGKYPVLRLAERAATVLRGEERVLARVRRARAVEHEAEYDAELFDALRAWRAGEARNDGVPPYVICSDKVLADLAAYLPHTPDELLRISGIGTHRAQRFGTAMLATIARHAAEYNLVSRMADYPSPTTKGAAAKRSFASDSDTVSETLAYYRQSWSVARIATHRALTEQTIVAHLAQCVRDGRIPVEDVRAFVPEDRERTIRAAFAQVGVLDALSPVKQALPRDISYADLHFIRAVIQREAGSP